ncbi:hypothetical protein AMTRI_Chr13g118890 [Amborella trichopoda]|uniref:Pectinesterase n=1 Tax=Amborella trichopoda TaxID=13333 RepID=W1NWN1_AMBTC|nr:pectinesterase/pectinesterase inhibitor PPE8B [Amborella trichopoda]ERN00053.1 hypothetical protein AMTR_s00105p00078750 [Amborella trichopoda]|eukprot:XP_020519198.1 pectinesterase/pectinesterase inhibitor PPE8B [Amborella trichopoda]
MSSPIVLLFFMLPLTLQIGFLTANLLDRKSLSTANEIHVAVSQNGSARFRSVQEAVEAAPDLGNARYVVHVVAGIYFENVEVRKRNVMLIGDGKDITVISGNRSIGGRWKSTMETATFGASAYGFIAKDITFENTAGPEMSQAVALRVDSDESAFYRCSIKGFQDTLYARTYRQFYRECDIYGTIDFIFGDGTAIFQNCVIETHRPLPHQQNVITAQGRINPQNNTGFSFINCTVRASNEASSTPTYLGRPWKQYSRSVFMKSYLQGIIQSEGWLAWDGSFALNTLFYAEYKNYGPGSTLGGRVKWPGYHIIRNVTQANEFTVLNFIDGGSWLPSTGIEFYTGLPN